MTCAHTTSGWAGNRVGVEMPIRAGLGWQPDACLRHRPWLPSRSRDPGGGRF